MNIIIFGSGQGGQMTAAWIPASCSLLAYADNDSSKWGTAIKGIPIINPSKIPNYQPDLIWISVLNKEASGDIAAQLKDMGLHCPIQHLAALVKSMDLRLASLRLAAKEINKRNIYGEVAELGVFQGVFAAEMNRIFPDKKIYLFDTFSGFSASDIEAEQKNTGLAKARTGDFNNTSVEQVAARLPHPLQAVFCPGHFPESVPTYLPAFSFVSIDPDLYEPVYQGLKIFWPLLSPGGMILIHDYNSTQFPGAGMAANRFCEEENIMPIPIADVHGSAILLKQFT